MSPQFVGYQQRDEWSKEADASRYRKYAPVIRISPTAIRSAIRFRETGTSVLDSCIIVWNHLYFRCRDCTKRTRTILTYLGKKIWYKALPRSWCCRGEQKWNNRTFWWLVFINKNIIFRMSTRTTSFPKFEKPCRKFGGKYTRTRVFYEFPSWYCHPQKKLDLGP